MKLLKVLLLLVGVALASAACRATVPSSTAFLQYTYSGAALPVTFVFQNTTDLLVLDSKSSPPVTLVLNSDYSVSGGAGSTGSISIIPGGTNGVQAGDIITILRSVPLTQTTNFSNTGPLTAAMIGQSLDKLTQITQQQAVKQAVSLQFQGDETLSGLLPLTARKGKLLGFDNNGAVSFSLPSGGGGSATVQGTANEIGVNYTSLYTIFLPTALTFTGKTVTGGTINADTLTTNGELGVGTTNPIYAIDVQAAGPAQMRLFDTQSGGGNILFGASNAIATGGSFILPSGQLDILPGGVVNISRATAVNPTAPSNSLIHLTAPDATQAVLSMDTFGAGAAPIFMGRRAGGTSSIPTGAPSASALFALVANGYGSTGYSDTNSFLAYITTETWTDAAQGSKITFGTTATGTTTQSTVLTLGPDKSATFSGEIINQTLHVAGTSNLVKTGDIVLADIPGLTINVVTGGKYNFRAVVMMSATTTGGFRTVLAGTAIFSDMRVQNDMSFGPAGGTAVVSTSAITATPGGNTQASTSTNATGKSVFDGSFTVSSGGTVKIQFCQNNNAGASTAYAESTIDAWRTQ